MAKIDVVVKSHVPETEAALEEQIELGLMAIGQTAEGYAKGDCPVDTGRLRNSITWATQSQSGGGSGADSIPQGTPEKHAVYIGTNVSYGVYVEYCDYKHTTGKRHFLRDAAAYHGDRYKEIMKAALEAGII
jgi:hypothetical protein